MRFRADEAVRCPEGARIREILLVDTNIERFVRIVALQNCPTAGMNATIGVPHAARRDSRILILPANF